jgi:hypothetical protein
MPYAPKGEQHEKERKHLLELNTKCFNNKTDGQTHIAHLICLTVVITCHLL